MVKGILFITDRYFGNENVSLPVVNVDEIKLIKK
jgi:hypothetical protein